LKALTKERKKKMAKPTEEENVETPEKLNLEDEIDSMIGAVGTDELPPELDTVDHSQTGETEEEVEETEEIADGDPTSDDEGEPEVEEEQEKETPEVEVEVEEEAGTPAEPTIESLQATIAEMQRAINDMAAGDVAPVKTPGDQQSVDEEARPAPDAVKKQFVQVDDIDEVFKDKDAYNAHLLQVQDRVFQAAVSNVVPMIGLHIKQALTLNEASKQFYRDNPDLENFRELVAQNINREAAKDPSASLDKVLNAAATATRTILKLPAPGTQSPEQPKTAPRKAALPTRSSSPRRPTSPVKTTGLESEIDDMLDNV
jgi:hypothetical protein